MAQRGVDVVFLQRVVEGAGQRREEDGGGEGEADQEDAADGRYDCRDETSPAAEECEEADDHFDSGRDGGYQVGNEHPFGHGAVHFEAVRQLLAKQGVGLRLVQTPHFDGVEPEFVGAFGAVGNVVVGVVF